MEDLSTKVANLLRKKAFLHWYTIEGLEHDDLLEAHGNIRDIISNYEMIVSVPDYG